MDFAADFPGRLATQMLGRSPCARGVSQKQHQQRRCAVLAAALGARPQRPAMAGAGLPRLVAFDLDGACTLHATHACAARMLLATTARRRPPTDRTRPPTHRPKREQ